MLTSFRSSLDKFKYDDTKNAGIRISGQRNFA